MNGTGNQAPGKLEGSEATSETRTISSDLWGRETRVRGEASGGYQVKLKG